MHYCYGWVPAASTVCTGCVIFQYTGPEQYTPWLMRGGGGGGARGTLWKACFLRDLPSLELKKMMTSGHVSTGVWS